MLYDYACNTCSNIQEEMHSVDGFKEFTPKCVKCGGDCKYKFTPSVPQIAFLDGDSGSWPSKGERIKKQMQARSDAAGKRQRERYGDAPTAIPNYNGDIAPSWAEARSEALVQGGSDQANTYIPKIIEENKKKLTV
jgi:hypothetical protein